MSNHPELPEDDQSRQAMSLNEYQYKPFLADHFSTAAYLLEPQPSGPSVPDQVYHSNQDIWNAVINESLCNGAVVTLENFLLLEWVPRSPGLYYTNRGKYAREDARRNIASIENGVVIYNPYGKQSMLDGGVGNIRLKPVIHENIALSLMSATSTGICHQGFPVALPKDLYVTYLPEIRRKGAICCTVVGELMFVPDKLESMYHGYSGVPKLFLQVGEIRRPQSLQDSQSDDLRVSLAVSFKSEFEGQSKPYACYVSFAPHKKASFQDSLNWMEHDYITTQYQGKVLTDFDEQTNHFPDAVFSLGKMLANNLNETDASVVIQQLHLHGSERIFEFLHRTNIQQAIIYRTEYNINNSSVGAVGDNASAQNFNIGGI